MYLIFTIFGPGTAQEYEYVSGYSYGQAGQTLLWMGQSFSQNNNKHLILDFFDFVIYKYKGKFPYDRLCTNAPDCWHVLVDSGWLGFMVTIQIRLISVVL